MTPAWQHACNSRCGGGAHWELVWLLPLDKTVVTLPGVSPYQRGVAAAMLNVLFHHGGWRVRDFELAKEAGPCPWTEHTEPWMVALEPCPDCGPPSAPPFARDDDY